MNGSTVINDLFHDRLREASNRILWLGILMVALGIAAIVFPIISTIVATLLVGSVFLLAGLFGLFGSFSIHGTGPFFGALLFSLLSIVAGAYMLVNPTGGATALTLVVGILFIVQGAFEIVFAFEMRPLDGWVGMLISGIASVILAIVIVAYWPGASVIVLGILLGVNFLTSGIAYIVVSRALTPTPKG